VKQAPASHQFRNGRFYAISTLIGIAALSFCLMVWREGFTILSSSSGDLAAEHYFIDRTCQANNYWPGWPINPNNNGAALGNFAPNIALYAIFFSSCKLSLITRANSLQTFLATGITMTLSLGYIACRAADLSKFTSLFSAISVTTAPCAISRLGHLSLSQLWPVLPTISCCLIIVNGHKIARHPKQWIGALKGYGLGCLLGTLAFPGQDYYIIFGSALVASCATWKCSCPKKSSDGDPLEETGSNWATLISLAISTGFISINLLVLTSKILLWTIPSWASEATRRLPSEQFSYGFWPLALGQSPIYNSFLSQRLEESGIILNESPFASSGSLLIIIAAIIAISRLRRQALPKSASRPKKSGDLLSAASVVFLISLAIALLCTSAGSFGTLFAVFISPQLRALNRFLPYLYAPAVVVVALWLENTILHIKQEFKIEVNS